MKRQPWFEIHDSPWFPKYLRDLVTEALELIWDENHTYRPIVGRLRDAVRSTASDTVVDLCSGGGGPWLGLYEQVADQGNLRVCLTDRYPSDRLLRRVSGAKKGVRAIGDPVNALSVPERLCGFRTVFSSFHHFDPAEARALLADAFDAREGIGVFEAARPNFRTIVLVIGVPLLALKTAITARPFRWSRFFWTWIVPVVPAVLWFDGVLSCLRSYSESDMRELVQGLSAPDYVWEIGVQQGGTVEIQYLLGIPLARTASVLPGPAVASQPA